MLTLMLLVVNLANKKECKKTEKCQKHWHMGTHLRASSESYPINTNMKRLVDFQKSLHSSWSLCFGLSSPSIGGINFVEIYGTGTTFKATNSPHHFIEKCFWGHALFTLEPFRDRCFHLPNKHLLTTHLYVRLLLGGMHHISYASISLANREVLNTKTWFMLTHDKYSIHSRKLLT